MLKIHPIQNIRQRRTEVLKNKLSNKFENQKKEFYGEFRTYEDMYDFERFSRAAESYIAQKPLDFSDSKYYISLEKINLFGLNMDAIRKIFRKDSSLLSEIIYGNGMNVPYEAAVDKYYNQQEFRNPSEQSLKDDIEFKKVKCNKKLTQEVSPSAFSKEAIIETLENSKNLTLDSGSLLKAKYDENTPYDFPMVFATACYNSRNQGNGYIIDKIPEIFEGISVDEIIEKMDLLSTRYRIYSLHGVKDLKITTEIGGKNFNIEPIHSGEEARTFKITDDENRCAILKFYHPIDEDYANKISVAPYGAYGNIGLMREANKAGVKDIPELYIANPIFIPIKSKNSNFMGGWAIVENVENKKIELGLFVLKWLDDMGLYLLDDKANAWVDGHLVDFGFITSRKNDRYYNYGWGDELVNQVYSRYLNQETTQEIIDFLKSKKVTYTDDMHSR